jgi:hypothetical protein
MSSREGQGEAAPWYILQRSRSCMDPQLHSCDRAEKLIATAFVLRTSVQRLNSVTTLLNVSFEIHYLQGQLHGVITFVDTFPPCRRQRAGPPVRQPLKPVWSCGQVRKTDLLSITVDQPNMGVAPMERTIFQLAHSTSHGVDIIAMSVPFATGIVVAVHMVRCATLPYIGAEYFGC